MSWLTEPASLSRRLSLGSPAQEHSAEGEGEGQYAVYVGLYG